MSFVYPSDVAPKLREVWKTPRLKGERVPDLPKNEILTQLVEVAYHASLLAEEERRLRFRLAYYSRRSASRKPKHRFFDSYAPVVLDEARSFTVAEILRLAPATDLTRTLICVEPNGDDELVIWGLLDTGGSWWQFSHHEARSGRPPPNCLTISCSEPGNLTISRQGWILQILRRGVLTRPSGQALWDGPVADFFSSARDTLHEDACQACEADRWDPEGKDEDYPRRFYTMFMDRVLFHIREKGHGGTLIVLPDSLKAPDSRLTDRLNIKYYAAYSRSWRLLIEHLRLHRHYYESHFDLWDREELVDPELYRALAMSQQQMEELELAISDSVHLIASLSGVDGAVVLTDRLRLIGFGAEVVASSPSLTQVRMASDTSGTTGTQVDIEAFGTRHRSAFRLCSSYEQTVAFVVSQDGGTKAIRRVGDQVVMWADLDVLPFGL